MANIDRARSGSTSISLIQVASLMMCCLLTMLLICSSAHYLVNSILLSLQFVVRVCLLEDCTMQLFILLPCVLYQLLILHSLVALLLGC